MVATAETAPIERIPLKKMEGPKRPKVQTAAQRLHRCPNERTAAPPLHGPHGSPTAAQSARQPRRCAVAQKARGPQKAAAPDSLLFAAEATFAALTPVFAHRARCRIDTPRSPG